MRNWSKSASCCHLSGDAGRDLLATTGVFSTLCCMCFGWGASGGTCKSATDAMGWTMLCQLKNGLF